MLQDDGLTNPEYFAHGETADAKGTELYPPLSTRKCSNSSIEACLSIPGISARTRLTKVKTKTSVEVQNL